MVWVWDVSQRLMCLTIAMFRARDSETWVIGAPFILCCAIMGWWTRRWWYLLQESGSLGVLFCSSLSCLSLSLLPGQDLSCFPVLWASTMLFYLALGPIASGPKDYGLILVKPQAKPKLLILVLYHSERNLTSMPTNTMVGKRAKGQREQSGYWSVII